MVVVVVAVSSLPSCNCGDLANADAGHDAGVLDSGLADAGLDAGRDAGVDAGVDAGFDAGVDAGCVYGADGGPIIPDGGLTCVSTGTLPWNLYFARAGVDGGPGAIWVRLPDGSAREVVDGARPTVSPDGRLLAFLRDSTTGNGSAEGSRGDVWVLDLTNGAQRKLFTNTDFVVSGSFTPDSGTFVFDYLCGLNQVPTSGASGATGFPTWGGCYTDMPAVSPDGRQVAVRNLFSGLGIEDFDGQNQRFIWPVSSGHISSSPQWSHAMDWISYIDGPLDDLQGQARKLRPDGGGDRPLSNTDVCGAPLTAVGPAVFTPDDGWVVVAGTGSGISALWALAADGSGETMRLCVPAGPPVIFSGGAGPLPVIP